MRERRRQRSASSCPNQPSTTDARRELCAHMYAAGQKPHSGWKSKGKRPKVRSSRNASTQPRCTHSPKKSSSCCSVSDILVIIRCQFLQHVSYYGMLVLISTSFLTWCRGHFSNDGRTVAIGPHRPAVGDGAWTPPAQSPVGDGAWTPPAQSTRRRRGLGITVWRRGLYAG